MVVPMNKEDFELFIAKNKIFEKTHKLMMVYLENWYAEDKEEFIKNMWADIDTVITTYRFEHEGVSISKSYSYEPPLDYISCWIRLYDEEGCYCTEYTAFFDYELRAIDDKMDSRLRA